MDFRHLTDEVLFEEFEAAVAAEAKTTIPAATKRKVWIRDRGQGTHPGCNSKHFLEFDHIIRISFGGTHEDRIFGFFAEFTITERRSRK